MHATLMPHFSQKTNTTENNSKKFSSEMNGWPRSVIIKRGYFSTRSWCLSNSCMDYTYQQLCIWRFQPYWTPNLAGCLTEKLVTLEPSLRYLVVCCEYYTTKTFIYFIISSLHDGEPSSLHKWICNCSRLSLKTWDFSWTIFDNFCAKYFGVINSSPRSYFAWKPLRVPMTQKKEHFWKT